MQATGPFEVKLTPAVADERLGAAFLGRILLDKAFHGALEAVSFGQMLAVQSGVPGSAGYVAIEQVTGILSGRDGSFMLQHSGTADRGATTLSVGVIPDSGTGELAGISGTMRIDVTDGQHLYTFDYSLPQ